jgi:hypothetical protein
MPFWRREEPLHERLAREGGLGEPPPHDARPRWGEVGIHGVHRQREWDAVATVEVPALGGTEARFVTLEDGSILAETDDLDLEPLADALEGSLARPYRAEAVRREGSLWAVAARRIRVEPVPEQVDGDRVVLTNRDGLRTIEIDGSAAFGSLPALERLADDNTVLVARRLDDLLWEVEVTLL